MLNVSKLFVQTPQQYFRTQCTIPVEINVFAALLKVAFSQLLFARCNITFASLHRSVPMWINRSAAFSSVYENGCTSFAMISKWILIARVIVYCRRNSTGLLYPAERRSPSASRSLRTVRPPWFCSWLMSPWTDSPIPQPELDPRSTKPRARCPGPPCFPQGSRAHAHTCECTWNDNEWKMWHFRTRAITVSKQVSLIALLHLLLLSAIGQANG